MQQQPKRRGRRPGVPNKATTNAREAIAAFVEHNVPRLNGLLDEIEQNQGPAMAWRCIMDLIEYHVPKLARTEVVGDAEKPVQIVVKRPF